MNLRSSQARGKPAVLSGAQATGSGVFGGRCSSNLDAVNPPKTPDPFRVTPLALLLFVLICLIAVPGCGGCWGAKSSPTAKAKKKKDEKAKDEEELLTELEKKRKKKLEKPKDDFEPLAVRMLPSNDPAPSLKQPPVYVKPGHWTSVSETAKTNNFDFPGELATFVEQQATNLPLELEDKVSRLSSWCPAILPKGQSKRIEGLFYVPRRQKGLGSVYSLRSELRGLRGGRTEIFNTILCPSLKDYEHLIVVLAGGAVTPAAYTHFDRLLSVKMPQVEATESEPLRYYHVFRPSVEKNAPLPSHSLAWTTIAYVFWDDLDPGILTNQQQQALLDWLQWGGQLVISGPSSLDKLKGSFLAPYLPGESSQTTKLEEADFAELNKRFSLENDPARVAMQTRPPKGEKLRRITVITERPMVGVDLRLHREAREIEGTGGLVVERRIGGGRVVVTRFPLTDVRIKQWKNFDGFFNSVLLRRPGRVFDQHDQLAGLDVKWDDPNLHDMRLDARIGSTLRYFSRDIGLLRSEQDQGVRGDDWRTEVASSPNQPTDPNTPQGGRVRGGISGGGPVYGAPGPMRGFAGYYPDALRQRPDTSGVHPGIDDWHFAGYRTSDPLGVAAWDNDGAASQAARQILTEAAGIEIPSADFVIKVLSIYLLVLVPLNWLIFWLMGKVEWAWIAAPLIALFGAGTVIRLAQLDIGFARSRTEVAVLEVQGGYERAHLTRFTALYTSLSSSYSLSFDEPNSLATPFRSGVENPSLLSIAQYNDVAFRRDKDTSISGVQVSSNSTGMVHSEQMLSLGTSEKVIETLRLDGDESRGFSVKNTTDLAIRDIGIFRRVDQPTANGLLPEIRIEVAYVAKLEPASSAPLHFAPLDTDQDDGLEKTATRDGRVVGRRYPIVWLDNWNKVPIFADSRSQRAEGDPELDKTRVRLTRLARLASQRLRLLPGDVRLVGWTDQRLPGMRIRPEAPQNRTYTLVLAHLVRGALPPVRPDRNVAEDFIDPTALETEPENGQMPADGIDRDTEAAAGATTGM